MRTMDAFMKNIVKKNNLGKVLSYFYVIYFKTFAFYKFEFIKFTKLPKEESSLKTF